ncbi:hypothetical protein [Almyronema epifaneia]|uniref:Uncharacterized protein n=1 Tax=Almyronema epifaneia S1 TaxID=2991925 RepID=A0ABW6IJD4_9CYAN
MWDIADVTCANASLELLVRHALSWGELSPGAEQAIVRLTRDRPLSDRETKLLALLQDAIAAGVIQRLAVAKLPQEEFIAACA